MLFDSKATVKHKVKRKLCADNFVYSAVNLQMTVNNVHGFTGAFAKFMAKKVTGKCSF